MRYPGATWRPGPANKQGYSDGNRNRIEGIVLHSMDGFYATGGINILDNGPTSWHFSITSDGKVFQHYELEAVCWHAGDANQNRRLIGIEHEGVHSFRLDPITEAQIQASVALCQWIANIPQAWPIVRGQTIYEHRDLGTSECPGERFTPVWSRWTGQQPPLPGTPAPVDTRDLANGFDRGLTRIYDEEIVRQAAKSHRHAGGDPEVLIEIIQGER